MSYKITKTSRKHAPLEKEFLKLSSPIESFIDSHSRNRIAYLRSCSHFDG